MNRKSYDRLAFLKLWNDLGQRGVCLFTHLIVGFPGETEEEFRDLLFLINKTKHHSFSIMPICYSRRKGTRAALKGNKDEIPEEIKRMRVARLLSSYRKHMKHHYLARLRWRLLFYFHAKKSSLVDL